MSIVRSAKMLSVKSASSSSQQDLVVTLSQYDARAGRVDVVQLVAVPVGARLASLALFVKPGELIRKLKNEPTVEQKHCRRNTRAIQSASERASRLETICTSACHLLRPFHRFRRRSVCESLAGQIR